MFAKKKKEKKEKENMLIYLFQGYDVLGLLCIYFVYLFE